MITKALIIDEPWISKILSGEKVWEMRSSGCSIRGEIGLIRKGTGQVVGTALLETVSGPYGDDELASNFFKHYVGSEIIRKRGYKWRYAWHLTDVKTLDQPVRYIHKNGAVIWVNLDDSALSSLNQRCVCSVDQSKKDQQKSMPKADRSAPNLDGAIDSVRVKLTQGNINNNHFHLSSVLNFFPKDSIGGANSSALASHLLSIDSGSGEPIQTDIAGDKKIFRNRAMVRSFIQRNKLKAGDEIVITKTSQNSYRLSSI